MTGCVGVQQELLFDVVLCLFGQPFAAFFSFCPRRRRRAAAVLTTYFARQVVQAIAP
jgi:hypothetical protein